jgi:hypothetical protein
MILHYFSGDVLVCQKYIIVLCGYNINKSQTYMHKCIFEPDFIITALCPCRMNVVEPDNINYIWTVHILINEDD